MYVGPIACPDCQSPISTDVEVCPYCYSHAPATAPWNGWTGRWEVRLISIAAIAGCALSDLFLGTEIFKTLAAWLPRSS
jgi:RNA polymerase subunit RPABC4/transcription elongation factor Spt4